MAIVATHTTMGYMVALGVMRCITLGRNFDPTLNIAKGLQGGDNLRKDEVRFLSKIE
jgi:hypothetical protein